MTEKLDFNKLLRRTTTEGPQKEKVPQEFFQCAAFYARPVTEEVEVLQRLDIKQTIFNMPTYKLFKEINEELAKQKFIFPFYSKEIFGSQDDATKFLPIFIKQLIKKEYVPPTAILEDGTVDEEIIRFGIIPLQISYIEVEKEEFTGFTG